MYLLDANLLSEIRKIKQNKANQGVEQWLASVFPNELYTNVVVMMEIKRGILRKRRKDPMQADALQSWFNALHSSFEKRILSIDNTTADICASLHVPNLAPENDAWIASTALQHQLTLVTRNEKDFQIAGLTVFNPFL